MSKFIDDIKKVKEPRKHSIKGACKIRDLYTELKHDKSLPQIDLHTFRCLIRTMGKNLSQLILDGHIIQLPLQMGKICVYQKDYTLKFVNGKVKHNYKVDWGNTIKLWEDDEEARRDKTILYHAEDKMLLVKYYKHFAKFKNKKFFTFRVTSEVRRNVHKYSNEHNVMYHVN